MTASATESDDEIFARLDSLVYGSDEYISGREIRAAADRGRRWMAVWLGHNRERLCEKFRERGLLGSEFKSSLVEVATVIDVIMQFDIDRPVAAVLAAILIKRGLGVLCG